MVAEASSQEGFRVHTLLYLGIVTQVNAAALQIRMKQTSTKKRTSILIDKSQIFEPYLSFPSSVSIIKNIQRKSLTHSLIPLRIRMQPIAPLQRDLNLFRVTLIPNNPIKIHHRIKNPTPYPRINPLSRFLSLFITINLS